jgi:DNA-binding transcriptional regulator WhiA
MSGAAAFIPKIFLAGAFLGAIGCLSRADYNLPIFLFAYIAWNYLRVIFKFWSVCCEAHEISNFWIVYLTKC